MPLLLVSENFQPSWRPLQTTQNRWWLRLSAVCSLWDFRVTLFKCCHKIAGKVIEH